MPNVVGLEVSQQGPEIAGPNAVATISMRSTKSAGSAGSASQNTPSSSPGINNIKSVNSVGNEASPYAYTYPKNTVHTDALNELNQTVTAAYATVASVDININGRQEGEGPVGEIGETGATRSVSHSIVGNDEQAQEKQEKLTGATLMGNDIELQNTKNNQGNHSSSRAEKQLEQYINVDSDNQ